MRARFAVVFAWLLTVALPARVSAEPDAAVHAPCVAGTTPPATVPTPPATRTALVVFHANQADAVLESDWAPNKDVSPWYVVCTGACEERVVADARLRVAGPGMYASRTFKLPLGRERVAVSAEMESRSIAGGAILLAVGYVLLGVTSPTLVIGGLARDHGGGGLVGAGIGVGVAGAIVGTLGLVLMVHKVQYKESRVRVARRADPRLALPGGFGLEARGLTF